MVFNLFQFIGLFLLVTELDLPFTDIILVKQEDLNLTNQTITIKNKTYPLTNETVTCLTKLVRASAYQQEYLFIPLSTTFKK